MKRGWIFLFFIFLVACASEIKEELVEAQTNEAAIPSVKTPVKANCANECMKDGCVDNDFYRCEISENGCNYFVKVGPTLGKCNIGCLNDYDCNLNQNCQDNVTKITTIYYCKNVSKELEDVRLKMNASGLSFR